MTGVTLKTSHVHNTNLQGVYLDLSESDLSGTDLSGAGLSGSSFCDADLRQANLSGADLTNADLRGTDLKNANISRARLFEAVTNEPYMLFEGVPPIDRDYADLSEESVDFRGADLGVTLRQLAHPKWDGTTRLTNNSPI